MTDIPTKAELIAEIRREWLLLETLLNGLTEAQMTAARRSKVPGRSRICSPTSPTGKRCSSTVWVQPSAGSPGSTRLCSRRMMCTASTPRCIAESQGRPLSAVLLEFRNLYTGVLTVLEALDDAFLIHPMPLDYPLDNLIAWEIIRANTSDHYQEHRLALEAWLKGQGSAAVTA